MEAYKRIFSSDLTEAEKIAQAFDHITSKIIEHTELEIELRRAMQDRETIIKEQIKLGTVRHCRQIFSDAYKHATGQEAWDEQNNK